MLHETFQTLLRQAGIEAAAGQRRPTLTSLPHSFAVNRWKAWSKQRSNCIRSRNLWLTAIRSFFRVVALCEPSCLGIATRVMAIP